MKKTLPTNTETGASSVPFYTKINVFFRNYIFVIALGILMLNMMTYCSNSDFQKTALDRIGQHGVLLKKNLGKVHFLTATGQHIVGSKRAVGYSDSRFKRYIANIIIDNQIQGLGELTGGFKISIRKAQDIPKKNEKFGFFNKTFLGNNGVSNKLYTDGLYRAIVEGRLPEYIFINESEIKSYRDVPDEDNSEIRHLFGTIRASVFIKSWIKELKEWDTREVQISIPFKATVDVAEFAGISNPFGVVFDELDIPVILKPTAEDVARQKGF